MFDIFGNSVGESGSFEGLVKYDFHRDSVTGAFYTTLFVPQTDNNGNKQYPFFIWPNYPNNGIESTLEMNRRLHFIVAINGMGVLPPYGGDTTVTGAPYGVMIQNGVVLKEPGNDYITYPNNAIFTIDANGVLGYKPVSVTPQQLLNLGIVSAGNCLPLIYNYKNIEEYDDVEYLWDYINNVQVQDAQRQLFCQYENGDYLIITTEGRGNRGDGYFTLKQAQRLCREYGVKSAFSIDGGGSAQTVVGDKQLNNIYERQYGRCLPTYIVFNGTTQYESVN